MALGWFNYTGASDTLTRPCIPVGVGGDGYADCWQWTRPTTESSPITLVRIRITDRTVLAQRSNPNPGGHGYHRMQLSVKGKTVHLGAYADVANNRIWVSRPDSQIFDIITDNVTEYCISGNPNLCANFGNIVYVPSRDVFVAGAECGGHIVRVFRLYWDGAQGRWVYQRLKLLPFVKNTYRGSVAILPGGHASDAWIFARWGDAGTATSYWKLYRMSIWALIDLPDGTEVRGEAELLHDFSDMGLGGPCHHIFFVPVTNGGIIAVFKEEKKILYIKPDGGYEDITPGGVTDVHAKPAYLMVLWRTSSGVYAAKPETLLGGGEPTQMPEWPNEGMIPENNGVHAMPVMDNGVLKLMDVNGNPHSGEVLVVYGPAVSNIGISEAALEGVTVLDTGYVQRIRVPADGVGLSGPGGAATVLIDPWTLE